VSELVPLTNSDTGGDKCEGLSMTSGGDAEMLRTWLQRMCCALAIPVSSYFGGLRDRETEVVMTMSNSGPYPVTPVASQLYSSTPVAHHLLRSRSRRYTSVKYDPWSNPYSVLTTPHRLPCLDVSSPCTCYILHLVSFSPDLVYFTWT